MLNYSRLWWPECACSKLTVITLTNQFTFRQHLKLIDALENWNIITSMAQYVCDLSKHIHSNPTINISWSNASIDGCYGGEKKPKPKEQSWIQLMSLHNRSRGNRWRKYNCPHSRRSAWLRSGIVSAECCKGTADPPRTDRTAFRRL